MHIKQQWAALKPGQRTWGIRIGSVVGLVLLSWLFLSFSTTRERAQPVDESVDVDVMLPSRPNATLEELHGRILASDREIARLEKQAEQQQRALKNQFEELRGELEENAIEGGRKEMEAQIDYLTQRLRVMEQQMRRVRKDTGGGEAQAGGEPASRRHGGRAQRAPFEIPSLEAYVPPGREEGASVPSAQHIPAHPPRVRAPLEIPGSGEAGAAEDKATEPLARRVISGAGSWDGAETGDRAAAGGEGGGDYGRSRVNEGAAKVASMARPDAHGGVTARQQVEERKQREVEKDKQVYMPSGSMFAGVLLNGADVSVSGITKENPVPVLIRIKRDAILPNYYALQVRECFALASGYGDLASERAILRLEQLSCVRTDGEVIDTGIDGYIVGSDGKVGLRGRLVNKQGQLLARSMVAGMLSGFADALKPTGVKGLDLNPDGTTSTTSYDINSVLEAGAFSGASNAAEKVADYYLELAEQTLPVIEVDAGRDATIVIIKGVALNLG